MFKEKMLTNELEDEYEKLMMNILQNNITKFPGHR